MRESAIIGDDSASSQLRWDFFCGKLGEHEQIARHHAKFRCSNLNDYGDMTIY